MFTHFKRKYLVARFARNCFSLGYNLQIAIDNKILSCYNHLFVNAFVTRG